MYWQVYCKQMLNYLNIDRVSSTQINTPMTSYKTK